MLETLANLLPQPQVYDSFATNNMQKLSGGYEITATVSYYSYTKLYPYGSILV